MGSGRVIVISYHDTVNVLQGTIAADATSAASPFARQTWFSLLEAAGIKPFVAMAKGDDVTVALALMRSGSKLQAMTNWYSFNWRPFAKNCRQSTVLLQNIFQDIRQHTHHLVLAPVPDEDGTATQLEAALKAAGWRVEREQSDHNYVLPVAGRTFAEYWASRPGKMRTTQKRKGKKVTVEILNRFDPQEWNAYEAIYAQSWKPAEGDPELLRQFARTEGDAGRIRFGIARHEGQTVAAQFWTVDNGTAYIHKLAHLEQHKSLSAGAVLTAALFEHVIDQDQVSLVDFGTGNDPYKRDWMELDRPRYRLECIDPSNPRAWPLLARRAAARVARAMRRS